MVTTAILPKFRCSPLNIGVNNFAFFVGTRMEEEINQLCLVLWLQLEYGMVTTAILLHLSLSRPNFAALLIKGVNDLASIVVHTESQSPEGLTQRRRCRCSGRYLQT